MPAEPQVVVDVRQQDDEPEADLWALALGKVLADSTPLRVVFQPIVDLARGVVAGYEALVRFDGAASTEEWFGQARRHGCAAALEARCIADALALRPHVPARCFLTVNCGPDVLTSPEVTAAFAAAGDLTGIVVELTEQVDLDALPGLDSGVRSLRARGATIAVDDVGSGYAGLTQLLSVRPQIVKLDRELVRGIHRDPAKQAAVEMLGSFVGRLDAWLVAEGVELAPELDTVVRLGVPLAQGWALGRPAAPLSVIDLRLAERLRSLAVGASAVGTLASVLTRETAVRAAAPSARLHQDPWVETDGEGCPRWLHLQGAAPQGADAFLRMHHSTALPDAAQRAMTRAAGRQFDPLVCVDDTGRYVGLVHLTDLVGALARLSDTRWLLEALP